MGDAVDTMDAGVAVAAAAAAAPAIAGPAPSAVFPSVGARSGMPRMAGAPGISYG